MNKLKTLMLLCLSLVVGLAGCDRELPQTAVAQVQPPQSVAVTKPSVSEPYVLLTRDEARKLGRGFVEKGGFTNIRSCNVIPKEILSVGGGGGTLLPRFAEESYIDGCQREIWRRDANRLAKKKAGEKSAAKLTAEKSAKLTAIGKKAQAASDRRNSR